VVPKSIERSGSWPDVAHKPCAALASTTSAAALAVTKYRPDRAWERTLVLLCSLGVSRRSWAVPAGLRSRCLASALLPVDRGQELAAPIRSWLTSTADGTAGVPTSVTKEMA
jgi:hypothetical protein